MRHERVKEKEVEAEWEVKEKEVRDLSQQIGCKTPRIVSHHPKEGRTKKGDTREVEGSEGSERVKDVRYLVSQQIGCKILRSASNHPKEWEEPRHIHRECRRE